MKRKPQPLGFHLKLGVLLMFGWMYFICISLFHAEGSKEWAELVQPGAVVLWKADKQLAALTPGCDAYDYTCVIAASK